MSVSGGAGVASTFGDMYTQSAAKGVASTTEILGAALASNTIQVANESWHRQYDRFLDIFA